jgi:hypothetical protein
MTVLGSEGSTGRMRNSHTLTGVVQFKGSFTISGGAEWLTAYLCEGERSFRDFGGENGAGRSC